MADKEVTMVLKVDLECERCSKKIRRVLHKIKDKMNIKTISFDEERNLVTISGPFDAEKVRRKLCSEASRIIKGMDVKAAEEKKEGDMEKDEDGTKPAAALEEKKTEEKKEGDMEKEEDGGKKASPAPVTADLRPLLEKMVEHRRPKPRTQPVPCNCCHGCSCSSGKQAAQPANAHVVVAMPASSVSGHGYEAPSSSSYYSYGMPVYCIEGW